MARSAGADHTVVSGESAADEVLELARTGRIRTMVTRFGLDDAVDAYRALETGMVEGRAVVVP